MRDACRRQSQAGRSIRLASDVVGLGKKTRLQMRAFLGGGGVVVEVLADFRFEVCSAGSVRFAVVDGPGKDDDDLPISSGTLFFCSSPNTQIYRLGGGVPM